MERIDLSELSSKGIVNLEPDIHSESEIYTDYKNVYKIFKDLTLRELMLKRKKIEILSSLKNVKSAVLPNAELFIADKFMGYSMDYIDGVTLFKRQFGMKMIDYLSLLSEISKEMREVHYHDIIFGDLSFFNILISEDGKFHFIDLDSVMIDDKPADRVSYLISEYYVYMNKCARFDINLDRLSLLLFVINYLFSLNLEEISMYEYDMKSEELPFLRDIRKTIVKLKNGKVNTHVPYLDEVIDRKVLK